MLNRGFTILELLLFVAVAAIVCVGALVPFTRSRDVAREATTRANIKLIRVAIERYATDEHGNGYPAYLLGGDPAGWTAWHARHDEPSSTAEELAVNRWLIDPLLHFGYLPTYPRNPFVGESTNVILQTGGTEPGTGDPRFGHYAKLMGNGLDDPKFTNCFAPQSATVYLKRPGIEMDRTLTANLGTISNKAHPVAYAMGGRRDFATPDSFVSTHWPGNFFYRGTQHDIVTRKGWSFDSPALRSSRVETSGYLLGAYGAFTTTGLDCIRLESTDPAGNALYYRYPPPYYPRPGGTDFKLAAIPSPDFMEGGIPELIGGGDAWSGPVYQALGLYGGSDLLAGAPDGIPDGVIVLHTPQGYELPPMVRTW